MVEQGWEEGIVAECGILGKIIELWQGRIVAEQQTA